MVHGWETDRYFTGLADFTDFLERNKVVNIIDLMFSFLFSHNHDSCELSLPFCLYFQLGFWENFAPLEQKHCSSFVYLISVPSAPLSVIWLLEMELSAEIFIFFILSVALFYLLCVSNLYYNDYNGGNVGSLFTDQLC